MLLPSGLAGLCASRRLSLLTHRRPLAKDPPTAETASDEGVEIALLAAVHLLLHQQKHLVDGDKLGEAERVRARRREDAVDALAPRLVGEERGHDERVREAHLDAVDETVARALDHGQEVVVRRAVGARGEQRGRAREGIIAGGAGRRRAEKEQALSVRSEEGMSATTHHAVAITPPRPTS